MSNDKLPACILCGKAGVGVRERMNVCVCIRCAQQPHSPCPALWWISLHGDSARMGW